MTNSTSYAESKLDTNDEYIKRPLNSSKKSTDSNDSDSTPSPPCYSVLEDKYGNLINKGLNVIWPMRPKQGRYSLDEYRKQKQNLPKYCEHHGEYRRRSEKCRKCVKRSERQSDVSRAYTSKQINDNNNVYIGVQSISNLRTILKPSEFCLFYMRPESMNSFNEMPIKMPLMLAYKSSSGKVYNFNFKRYQHNAGTCWQLDLSNIDGPQQPIFHSMSALVQHYKSFVIDRGNNKWEVFPVD
ncbi:unnamed protein product [Onchocerca ochengi]|uniref:SH2 domain-containing protein n=2 Tax=Onchocerca TaxID=6281 RepID=A0A182EML8_ONCOC|nr:unnamed protein product [Onchocerca ochengi]